MVISELALLEMKVEPRGLEPPKLAKPRLGKTPKALDPVNVALPIDELVLAMIHPQVLGIPHAHEPIIAPPAIRVNDRLKVDFTPNGGLKGHFRDIREDLRIDLTVPLEDAEHDGLSEGSPAPSSFDPLCSKVGFINLNLSLEGGGLFTGFGGSLPDSQKIAVDGVPIEMGEPRDLDSV